MVTDSKIRGSAYIFKKGMLKFERFPEAAHKMNHER